MMTKGHCGLFPECDSAQMQSQQVGVLLAKGAMDPLIVSPDPEGPRVNGTYWASPMGPHPKFSSRPVLLGEG